VKSCVEGNQYETLPLDHLVKSSHSHSKQINQVVCNQVVCNQVVCNQVVCNQVVCVRYTKICEVGYRTVEE
jgi:hypothetical protein